MPGSVKQGKAEIKEWVEGRNDIAVIVDVGCGNGTYAKLLGNNNDLFFIGIEIFEPYIDQFQLRGWYDKIITGDVRFMDLPKGDLVIFGDVLEHMEKHEAMAVLERAKSIYPHMVISIPVDGRPSRIGKDGNTHNAHISDWTFAEVEALDNWIIKLESKGMGIFIR